MTSFSGWYERPNTVREYTEQHYLPAASAYLARAAGKGEIGVEMINWRHDMEQKWGALVK